MTPRLPVSRPNGEVPQFSKQCLANTTQDISSEHTSFWSSFRPMFSFAFLLVCLCSTSFSCYIYVAKTDVDTGTLGCRNFKICLELRFGYYMCFGISKQAVCCNSYGFPSCFMLVGLRIVLIVRTLKEQIQTFSQDSISQSDSNYSTARIRTSGAVYLGSCGPDSKLLAKTVRPALPTALETATMRVNGNRVGGARRALTQITLLFQFQRRMSKDRVFNQNITLIVLLQATQCCFPEYQLTIWRLPKLQPTN
ncbi:Hypothetical_protein [Hexamita inflata]|uniref:Hypothetical_protein n=1 Tax=Hexamita inflata TaxID=28002 RepID=A0AA86TPG5_9EUKA|nr:Hypothetical protein HINF_LOCUS6363 [Hexamita inflata]